MRLILATLCMMTLTLLLVSPALGAPDAALKNPSKVINDAPPVKKAPASQPSQSEKIETPDPVLGTKPPRTVKEGIETGRSLWQAIKDKAWWLVAALGIFLAMLVLQVTGLFKKMGKRVTWLVAGGMSLLAAMFVAFDKSGFSWDAFLAFATAGPTVAWLRGFIKKAVLNFQKKET